MPLNLDAKKEIVAQIRTIAETATSAVVADYRGLTVAQLHKFRVQARGLGLNVHVVRNTLVRRAVEATEFSCIQEVCVGPSIFVFSQEDPGAAARLCREYAKNHEKFSVKGLSLGKTLLSPQHLEAVANLPTRDQAISLLMAVVKAPVAQFVRTLAEPHAKLVRTIAAVGHQKESAA